MRALGALMAALVTEPDGPLVGARGLVAGAPRLPTLPAAGPHVLTSAKQFPEESDLIGGGRGSSDRRPWIVVAVTRFGEQGAQVLDLPAERISRDVKRGQLEFSLG